MNGMTILVVMALIGNFLVVGFVYRYHSMALMKLEKDHNKAYTELLAQGRKVKGEVILIEGVRTWEETAFAQAQKPKERNVAP